MLALAGRFYEVRSWRPGHMGLPTAVRTTWVGTKCRYFLKSRCPTNKWPHGWTTPQTRACKVPRERFSLGETGPSRWLASSGRAQI